MKELGGDNMKGNKNRTILVVNDVASKRYMSKEVLEQEGFSVKAADSWADAQEKIAEGGLGLVILDLKMLKEDNLEIIDMISSLRFRTD
jgi:CheY-like chemotaxis protein